MRYTLLLGAYKINKVIPSIIILRPNNERTDNREIEQLIIFAPILPLFAKNIRISKKKGADPKVAPI